MCVVFESIGRFEFGVLEQQLPEDCVVFVFHISWHLEVVNASADDLKI